MKCRFHCRYAKEKPERQAVLAYDPFSGPLTLFPVLPSTWLMPQTEEDFFTVKVAYGQDKDPVTFAAKPIAEVLRLMNDALNKIGKPLQNSAS